MWMLIQHLEVSRSHGCQIEIRTWAVIDCIIASSAAVYSAPFFFFPSIATLTRKHNSHQDANSGQSVRGKIIQSCVSGCCLTLFKSIAPTKKKMFFFFYNKCCWVWNMKINHYCENVALHCEASHLSCELLFFFNTAPTNVWKTTGDLQKQLLFCAKTSLKTINSNG